MTDQEFVNGPDEYTARIIEDALQTLERRVIDWDRINISGYNKFIELEVRNALTDTIKNIDDYIVIPNINKLQKKFSVSFVKIPKPFLDMRNLSDVFIISDKDNSYYVSKSNYNRNILNTFIDRTFLDSIILNRNNSVVIVPRKKIVNSAYGESIKMEDSPINPNRWEDMQLLINAESKINAEMKTVWNLHDIVIIALKDGKYYIAKNQSGISGMFIDEGGYKYITEIIRLKNAMNAYTVSFEELKRNITI